MKKRSNTSREAVTNLCRKKPFGANKAATMMKKYSFLSPVVLCCVLLSGTIPVAAETSTPRALTAKQQKSGGS